MDKDPIFELCDTVREAAYALHRYLGYGHLEKVYENGLAHRLRKRGVKVEPQHPLQVADEDGTILGEYFADLCVGDVLIVELKASKTLIPAHTAQLLGYLRATWIQHGLLINFGGPKLEVRKYVLTALGSPAFPIDDEDDIYLK